MDVTTFSQAEAYSKIPGPEKVDGHQLMKLLAIEKGNKVLDFGCGTGNLTKILADLVGPEGQVVGVDPDGERLKLARDLYSASNITYIQGSFESIPGTDYDIVYSNYVIMRCMDKDAVFKKMASVLKKGGKFGFVTGRYYNVLENLFKPAEAYSQEIIDSYSSALDLITPEAYAALAASDFETVYWKESEFVFKFTDVEELVNFFRINSGITDRSHINVDILKNYYQGGGAIYLPNLTAVLAKK